MGKQENRIQNVENQIIDLVSYTRDVANTEPKEIVIGKISNLQGQAIKIICGGIETNLCAKTLSSIQIIHALKGHGNDVEETKRGQKGIIDSDFSYIPQIINNPDSIERASNDYLGKPGILFKKYIKVLHIM